MNILKLAKENIELCTEVRRYLHQYPELSTKEYETTKYLMREMKAIGISCHPFKNTGFYADIDSTKSKNSMKRVLLRADMDALATNEENNITYKSKNDGVMHACGHDSHMAMLLAAAKILFENRSDLNNHVRILFQPNEEGLYRPLGSQTVIGEGALDGVDTAFGMHVLPILEKNMIAINDGPMLASADTLNITVKGKSGHGAAPSECVDPILVAAQIVSSLQSIVSREITPMETVVISICTINGGSKWNIIPDEVTMTGTVRTFSNEVRNSLPNILSRIVENIAKAYRADAKCEYIFTNKPVINDSYCTQIARDSALQLFGKDCISDIKKVMFSEDFSEYGHIVPSCFCLLGVGNKEKGISTMLHNSKFMLDEEAMANGIAMHIAYVQNYK